MSLSLSRRPHLYRPFHTPTTRYLYHCSGIIDHCRSLYTETHRPQWGRLPCGKQSSHYWPFVMGPALQNGHGREFFVINLNKLMKNKTKQNCRVACVIWDATTMMWLHCDTSNGSWCIGIKGEMSGTVCVTFTWDIYIYELFIAFVCFVVCSLL